MIERDETGGKTFANESPIQPQPTRNRSQRSSRAVALFEAFGTWFGFGLVVLGILSGIERMLFFEDAANRCRPGPVILVGLLRSSVWHVRCYGISFSASGQS